MKVSPIILVLPLLVGFASPASATSYARLSIPQLVQASDIIVVGVAAREEDKVVLRITEVLKGNQVEQLVLNRTHVKFNDLVIPLGKTGVHFLKRRGTGYEPFHPSCFQGLAELMSVKSVLGMFADPGRYLNLKGMPETSDFVYVLGEVFSKWRMTSQEIPSLQEHMKSFADEYYKVGPWVNDQVVRIECETDESGMVSITSAQPGGPLAEFFKHRLLTAFRWPELKEMLKPKFSVTVDVRIPRKVGSASRTEAIQFLRDQLKSTDSEVVPAALLALAKIRDNESVPLVVPLIEHEDRRIQLQAIKFLGWSQSKLAEKPLRELLEAKASDYPENHDLSDSAAISLMRIGMSESVPTLERAACHGVQRAIEAIGVLGRTESFEILLKAAERDPRRCAYMVNAFYWLVRRSNKEVAPWMLNSTWSQEIGAEKIPKWTAWWELNRKDFKVTKSQQEAIDETQQGGA